MCEMDRGGGVLLILPDLSSATSSHGPQDNMRGFFIRPDRPPAAHGTRSVHGHSSHQCTMARVAAGI